jgi:GDP/UDP-N,N'-diacetylbacillosamine 2-epimerase (hydrolysing)
MKNETLLEECDGHIRVLALSGIRSEYDLLYPLLNQLEQDPCFDLGVIVCGAHLSSLHNYSVREIETDGFRIVERIENLLYSDSTASKARSAGILLQSLAPVLARENPDLLLVLGDREESVVGALAGSYVGVPVVHLAGGDHTHPISGNVDEEVRHATTKLSHIHLTMAEAHSERVRRLGEEPWRVFTVGSGGVDRLRTHPGLSRDALAGVLGPDVEQDYLLLIHHPLGHDPAQGGEEIRVILEQCLRLGMPVFVGAPNSDPGSQGVIEVIEAYAGRPGVHLYRNLDRDAFAGLLRHASCLLGNSSLGLHEAGYLGVPVINVGERQRGRLAGSHVQFVDATAEAVGQALQRALDPGYRQALRPGTSLYGDGYMAERAADILRRLPTKRALLAKNMTY